MAKPNSSDQAKGQLKSAAKPATKELVAGSNQGEVEISDQKKRLMRAVLEEALATFRRGVNSPDPTKRKRFCEVNRWAMDKDDDWSFSFENICRTLQLDPAYIREGLQQLQRQALQPPSRERAGPKKRHRQYSRRRSKHGIVRPT